MNGRSPDRPDETARRRAEARDAFGDPRFDPDAHVGGEHASPADPHYERQPLGSLLRRLAHDVPDLVGKEMALARSELSDNLRTMRRGMVSMATGMGVLIPGVFVLLMAGVYGLALVVPLWASALIIGGAVSLIGIVMVLAGKRSLEIDTLVPDRTVAQVRRDAHILEDAHHARTRPH